MGTRGAVGFRYQNQDNVGYNHWDSYPDALGKEVIEWLSKLDINYLKEFYSKIDNDNDEDAWDWKQHHMNQKYELCNSFLDDSLFCEFAYIINLDTNMLEVYRGFNRNSNANGRYASHSVPGRQHIPYDKENYADYYGVVLVQEIPLNDIIVNRYQYEVADEDATPIFVRKEYGS